MKTIEDYENEIKKLEGTLIVVRAKLERCEEDNESFTEKYERMRRQIQDLHNDVNLFKRIINYITGL